MANPTNPLWQVANALWSMLEANVSFAAAVPADNRIKYTSTTDRSPEKDGALDSDYPCVRIRCIGAKPRPHRASNSSMIEARWSIEIFTGDQRFALETEDKFFDVWMAIYKALINWQTYLSTFTWRGNVFKVTFCRATEVEDKLTTDDLHYRQRGWNSVWIVETDIWFTTSTLEGT